MLQIGSNSALYATYFADIRMGLHVPFVWNVCQNPLWTSKTLIPVATNRPHRKIEPMEPRVGGFFCLVSYVIVIVPDPSVDGCETASCKDLPDDDSWLMTMMHLKGRRWHLLY